METKREYVKPANLNKVSLIGTLGEEGLKYSHEIEGLKFYVGTISIKRNSGVEDKLPLVVPGHTLEEQINGNDRVEIYGEFRSRNKENHLVLEVFVKRIVKTELEEDLNVLDLSGYICKKPIFRKTPFGREIVDLLIASNRGNSKSDYLPAIVWGRNAQFIDTCGRVGAFVEVVGRIQSRIFTKKTETGEVVEKTAYEISVSQIRLSQ